MFVIASTSGVAEPGEPIMGRVDTLYALLKKAGLGRPDALAPYIGSLHGNTEERPVAEQLIDLLLADRPELYEFYSSLRLPDRQEALFRAPAEEERSVRSHKAVGEFMAAWIEFERILRALTAHVAPDWVRPTGIPIQAILRSPAFPESVRPALERLRRVRNQLVHGIEVPDAEYLHQATQSLHQALDEMEKSPDPEVRRIVSSIRHGRTA